MPLKKSILEEEIYDALSFAQEEQESSTDPRRTFARLLANAIDAFVKSGDVQTGIQSTGIDPQGGSVMSKTTTLGKVR